MSLKNLSIRIRLVLWNAAVLLLILGSIFTGIYIFMQNRSEAMIRNKLDSGFQTIEDVVRNSEGDICDFFHLGQDIIFEVRKESKPVYQTEAWTEAGWTSKIQMDRSDPFGVWKTGDGRMFRLKKGMVPEYGFEIVYALDATDSSGSERDLAVILIGGIIVALILALIGGFFLAGRALSPVKTITRKAREITAERLSERLPVQNPHDEIGRLTAVFNDTLARLESSFERLRRFTADASHELRTPLTSIRSVGEVALQKPMDKGSYREAIGSILEETERLTRLADNLLILARGEVGKRKPVRRSVDVALLVNGVVEELCVLAEEKNQTLTTSFSHPVEAMVDEEILRLAVSNVLHNAIRYTPDGGDVAVSVSKAKNGNAVIDVADSGPGIPESERSRVFERFYRIDEARSRISGGAGLGLAIARWAVEVNIGTIAFLDKEKHGTFCRIMLPADIDTSLP
jgi:heavy metal sensor kinase